MNLVDMHNSWLVINSVVGCTNACKYCLLQDHNDHIKKPKIIGTPKEAVKELIHFKYYDKNIPLCLFPNTDIFLNKQNINYLIETLKELEKENIKNDLVIITKCLIPNFVLLNLKRLQQKGQNIVIYLSYSGLDTQLEPNINHENIIKNFKNLKKYKIPTIHYYRPFLPQNAPKENIQKTLKLIHKYTSISVITGLMFVPTLLEKQNFWPELKKMNTRDLQESISLWPKTAWDFFYKAYEESQFFYQTNTCALNAILKKPSLQYYGTYECKHFNHCSFAQRKLCQSKKEQIQKEEIVKKLKIFLKKLGITPSFHYKFDHQNSLKLEGINLDIKALAYLSFQLGIKVYIPNAMKLNKIYNSTLNGKRPFIVNEGEK